MDENWIIEETSYVPEAVPQYETLFALGNGFVGVRGSFEEHSGVYKPGTFINGFYETEPITYGEHAYGYAKNRQRMVPVTDGTRIIIRIDGEPFSLETGSVHRHYRFLDMRAGILTREEEWESPRGKRLSVIFRRVISSDHYHTAAVTCTVTPVSKCGSLSISSGLHTPRRFTAPGGDPRVGGILQQDPLLLVRKSIDSEIGTMLYRTRNSGLSYICSMVHTVRGGEDFRCVRETEEHDVVHRFEFTPEKDRPVVLEKFISYFTTLETPREDLARSAAEEASRALETGFDTLAAEKREYLRRFWQGADIDIESGNNLRESIRFNMFHLLQAAGKRGNGNIPAKGLTGEGYEGHYFWDTEIYMLPFFLYTVPEVARSLLMYRFKILPAARRRAEELHHKGALYPWRTINGEEASPYYPAGTAQYHINADIAYACRKYWKISGDDEFLLDGGGEILFETARFWHDFADFIPGKGLCFNCVTGPDEYTALVNNNAYTNYMAKMNLTYAAEIAVFLREHYPDRFEELSRRIGLGGDEIDDWHKAAAEVYLPYDRERGLIPQDDSFFDKAVWDFKSTPAEHYPLLLHYHPLTIYRYQVLKQPDLLLAFLLLSSAFTDEEKQRNFAYYDPLTTGDSSLTSCIQSIIATEIGKTAEGEHYFLQTARMDLDDINKNVKDGIHAAAMGGAWLTLIYGFAGLRDDGEFLSFKPSLPPSMSKLSFALRVRGQILSLSITANEAVYTLSGEGTMTILHYGKKAELTAEGPLVLHIYAH